MEDDIFIGFFSLRLKSNEQLKTRGSHIGFEIRPSYRNKGYAKKGLLLCLDKAKEIELSEVLIAHYKENTASQHIILYAISKRGGHFFDSITENGEEKLRYVVKTT